MRLIPALCCFSLWMTALCISPAWAQVRIIAFEIPGLHQQDFQGGYDKIINQILVAEQLAYLEIFPPARAEKLFSDCQNCCITPANSDAEFYSYDSEVIVSDAMNTAKIYIFSPPGSPIITSLSQLQDKVIGTRYGMPYGNTFVAANLKKIEVSMLKEHLKLIEYKHIDAFIAYAPDVFHMFEKAGITPFPHYRQKPYAVHPDALVCRGVSQDFINTFNSGLDKLKKSGDVKKILGDRYLP